MPGAARVVWVVERQAPIGDTGPVPRPSFVSVTLLRADAQGAITVPDTLRPRGALDAFAIVYAPGFLPVVRPFHAGDGLSAFPEDPAPVTFLTARANGCALTALKEVFLALFPPDRDTGLLSPHDYRRQIAPVVGDLVALLLEQLVDPSRLDEDEVKTNGTPGPEVCGDRPRRYQLRMDLFELAEWAQQFPQVSVAPTAITGPALALATAAVEHWLAGEAAHPSIRDALTSGHEEVRAWGMIAAWGARDEAAIPELLSLVASRRPREREFALFALGPLGAPPEAAVPAVIDLLKDDDKRLTDYVLSVLHDMTHSAHVAAARALQKLVLEPPSPVRMRGLSALSRLDGDAAEAMDGLIGALQSADLRERQAVLEVFDRMKTAGAVGVAQLARLLSHREAGVRDSASRALGMIGVLAKSAVPALAAQITDPDARVRQGVLLALLRIGPDSAPALATMIPRLGDPDAVVRAQAAHAIGGLGAKGAPAVAALATALSDPSIELDVAQALGDIGDASVAALPQLMRALEASPRAQVLIHAVISIGPRAAGALPNILGFVRAIPDFHGFTRGVLTHIVASMGRSAAPALARALDEPTADVLFRQNLLDALIATGDSSRIVRLLELLDELHNAVRSHVDGFVHIGEAAVLPLATVVRGSGKTRARATQALGALGAKAAGHAIPVLLEAMNVAELREIAIESIEQYGADVAQPILRAALRDRQKLKLSANVKWMLAHLP